MASARRSAVAAAALLLILQGAARALPAASTELPPPPSSAATGAAVRADTQPLSATASTPAPPTTPLPHETSLVTTSAATGATDEPMLGDEALEEEATDAPGAAGGGGGGGGDGVQLLLFTRAHPLVPLLLANDSLEGSDFDVGRVTVFVIHGFTGDAKSESVTLVRDAMLWAEDANVVVVEWSALAAGPVYGEAVNNTRRVAALLAARLAALAAAGLPPALVHLVGFSLGAQVAGQAGALLAASPLGRVARITGLDPARPGFHDAAPAQRLDADDADFVQVLHTASGIVSFEEPLGHADFYPNGGRSPQPACAGESVHVVCSHLVAPRYFAEAVYKPFNFRGTRCRSWRDFEAGLCAGAEAAFLGPNTPASTRGSFFLRTNANEPYGRGDSGDDAGTTRAPDDADEENRLDVRRARQHDASAAVPAAPGPAALAAALALALVARP